MLVTQLQNVILKRPGHIRASWPHSYSEALAASLVLYAKINPAFADTFKQIMEQVPRSNQSREEIEISQDMYVLIPPNIEAAERRAEWLLDHDALALSFYATDKPAENPKLIVVGLIVVAIPGITMGKLRRRKESMMFIMREDIAFRSDLDTTRKITEASHSLLAYALSAANNNSQKLEPEMADWFFGEKAMSFYRAREQEMRRIEAELKRLHIPHAAAREDGETHVLAISPAANADNIEAYWEMHSIT